MRHYPVVRYLPSATQWYAVPNYFAQVTAPRRRGEDWRPTTVQLATLRITVRTESEKIRRRDFRNEVDKWANKGFPEIVIACDCGRTHFRLGAPQMDF